MNIVDATNSYEAWLASHVQHLVKRDLKKKHKKMAGGSPFPFLRATFYRWAQRWREVCAPLAKARAVVAVGDLHVENFGTWRDADGRLVWGINDFDEACRMPFVSDLVRLVTSAALAAAEGTLSAGADAAGAAVLTGYREGIEAGCKDHPEWCGKARPFVIDPANRWLAILANNRDPATYWNHLRADLDEIGDKTEGDDNGAVPRAAARLLEQALPQPAPKALRLYRRQAGAGSLGRPRFVAMADWNGWPIAREVKALAPSAWLWARHPKQTGEGRGGTGNRYYERLLVQAVRSGDAYVRVVGGWVVRRLAPDCDKLDLPATANVADEERLLRAMGRETANIHLGTDGAAEGVLHDLNALATRSPDWLCDAARLMYDDTIRDWERWRKKRRDDGDNARA